MKTRTKVQPITATWRRTISFSLALIASLALLLTSCSPSTPSTAPETNTAEPVLIRPVQAEITPAVQEQLEAIKSGDADSSAKALIGLAPTAEAYLQYHEALLASAEVAKGEMNLDLLRKAGPVYHAWHAEKLITGPSRGLSILQWIGQKIWEAPKGTLKETAATVFIDDISDSIDAGRVERWQGGVLARNALMDLNLGILPGVSMKPVLALHKELVLTSSAANIRGGLFRNLTIMGHFLWCMRIDNSGDNTDVENLYEFLKEQYPEYRFANSGELFFPYYPLVPPPLTWDQYESLPSLSYNELGQMIETRCHCIEAACSFLGPLASRRLLSDYRKQPEAVLALVSRPKVLESLTLPLCEEILNTEGELEYLAQEGRLLGPIVGEICEKAGVKGARPWYANYANNAKKLLQRLDTAGATPRRSSTVALENELVKALLRASRTSMEFRLAEGGYPGALRALHPALSPEAKQYLRKTVQEMLDDPETFANMNPEGKQLFQESLTKLLTLPL